MKYTCDPDVELNGNSAKALLRSILSSEYMDVLERHGLIEIDEEQWYSLQDLLDVLGDINGNNNAMMEMVSIGMAAAENSIIPPEIAKMSVPEFLQTYARIYPTRHRNGDPGSMRVDVLDEKHLKIYDYTPYPDDLFYGMMYGFVRRFNHSHETFTLHYDENQPRKSDGGKCNVILVSFG